MPQGPEGPKETPKGVPRLRGGMNGDFLGWVGAASGGGEVSSSGALGLEAAFGALGLEASSGAPAGASSGGGASAASEVASETSVEAVFAPELQPAWLQGELEDW